jgi:lysine 2,3-aminomutase
MKGLRGHTTGYAVPNFVIDAPGGGGKVELVPEVVVGRDGDDLLLTNFEGGTYRYPDPGGRVGAAENLLRDHEFLFDSSTGLYGPHAA